MITVARLFGGFFRKPVNPGFFSRAPPPTSQAEVRLNSARAAAGDCQASAVSAYPFGWGHQSAPWPAPSVTWKTSSRPIGSVPGFRSRARAVATTVSIGRRIFFRFDAANSGEENSTRSTGAIAVSCLV